MANLHKTERKLPWLVRDGGLPSDWLGGRIGGNSLQSHSQTCVARQTQQKHTHTVTHPGGQTSRVCLFAAVEQVTM